MATSGIENWTIAGRFDTLLSSAVGPPPPGMRLTLMPKVPITLGLFSLGRGILPFPVNCQPGEETSEEWQSTGFNRISTYESFLWQ